MLKYEKKFYTDEIAKLQKRYDAFHSEDKFKIEKYAREHFHMRRPGEYMYIYDDEASN
jgi:cell division protein FtsB